MQGCGVHSFLREPDGRLLSSPCVTNATPKLMTSTHVYVSQCFVTNILYVSCVIAADIKTEGLLWFV